MLGRNETTITTSEQRGQQQKSNTSTRWAPEEAAGGHLQLRPPGRGGGPIGLQQERQSTSIAPSGRTVCRWCCTAVAAVAGGGQPAVRWGAGKEKPAGLQAAARGQVSAGQPCLPRSTFLAILFTWWTMPSRMPAGRGGGRGQGTAGSGSGHRQGQGRGTGGAGAAESGMQVTEMAWR